MNNLNSKSLICVEYPGIVKNVDRMLTTLGGLESLIKVCSSSSLRLQLRFRPNDPFSHCAIADKLQLNNFLAKTIKKRIHYSDGTSEIKYETVIVGLIESTYRFETLADFQYLPIERTNFNGKAILDRIVKCGKSPLNVEVDNLTTNQTNDEKQDDETSDILKKQSEIISESLDSDDKQKSTYKSIFKEVYPYDALNGEVRKFEAEAPLFVMPIIFSRFDSPSDYFYKDDPKRKGVNQNTEDEETRRKTESAISLNRKSRAKYVYLITFQDEPPKERAVNQDYVVADEKLMENISKEFELHPIWTKSELAYRNKCKKKELKLILPICAFYYTNGPFRGQWVKFGYNPKEDNGSRFYQTLDLRTSTVLKKKFGPHKVRKPATYNIVKSIHTVEKRSRDSVISHEKLACQPGPSKERNTNNNSNVRIIGGFRRTYVDEVTDERDFKFIAGQMPKNKQIFYQLRNIYLDEVQEVLKEEPKEQCDERDGWWPAGTIDKIRSLTLDYIDKLLVDSPTNLPDEEDKDDEIDDVEEEIMEYYTN